jgi:hypothetical protein
MWTLEYALTLIRKIAPIAERHGFSVALYGGVLLSGQSENDLDLFFVLQDPEICDVQGCLAGIAELPEIDHCGSMHEVTNGYCAVIWLRNGDHVDAQFRVCETDRRQTGIEPPGNP